MGNPKGKRKGLFMKLVLMLALAAGCSSTMVKKIGPQSKYAPANYQETGIVKYLNAGADWIIEKRRQSAYKEMYKACNGSYEIVREGDETRYSSSGGDYWMIEFRCKPQATKSPASEKVKASSLTKEEEIEMAILKREQCLTGFKREPTETEKKAIYEPFTVKE